MPKPYIKYKSFLPVENILFSIKQFGFMGGRSTTLQLLKVLDHWTTILDNGGIIDTIYTDFGGLCFFSKKIFRFPMLLKKSDSVFVI
jgi:hypothetical protein